MALQPALWDGPYKGALAGVVEMFRGSMFKAAGRVRVGGEATQGGVVVAILGMRARVLVLVDHMLPQGWIDIIA